MYPATVANSGVESQGGPRGSTTIWAPTPYRPTSTHEKLLNLQLGPGPGPPPPPPRPPARRHCPATSSHEFLFISLLTFFPYKQFFYFHGNVRGDLIWKAQWWLSGRAPCSVTQSLSPLRFESCRGRIVCEKVCQFLPQDGWFTAGCYGVLQVS